MRSRVHFSSTEQEFALALEESAGSISGKIFVLADTNTGRFCRPLFERSWKGKEPLFIEVPGGEEHKSPATCEMIWRRLLQEQADRSSLLVNLGGGMVTDLGGFAASLFKRGIRFMHVPTSFLGMIDAAIGGKVAVNFGNIKNSLGLFSTPEQIIICPLFLDTLPGEEWLNGSAELVKYALIADREMWAEIRPETGDYAGMTRYINRCVEIKEKVVKQDPYEQQIRKILNFGHTFGHAFESLARMKDLQHGRAVAAGMICESFLSHRIAGLQAKEMKEISEYLARRFPPVDLEDADRDPVIEAMMQDKKNRDGKIGFSLLTSTGTCVPDQYAGRDQIVESLNYYRQISGK